MAGARNRSGGRPRAKKTRGGKRGRSGRTVARGGRRPIGVASAPASGLSVRALRAAKAVRPVVIIIIIIIIVTIIIIIIIVVIIVILNIIIGWAGGRPTRRRCRRSCTAPAAGGAGELAGPIKLMPYYNYYD